MRAMVEGRVSKVSCDVDDDVVAVGEGRADIKEVVDGAKRRSRGKRTTSTPSSARNTMIALKRNNITDAQILEI